MIINKKKTSRLCTGTSISFLMCLSVASVVFAQDSEIERIIVGDWVINDELSDDTDDQVEAAIREGGGRARRSIFNRQEDYYRGGPPEQELYDRLSYDDVLTISYEDPELRFEYADGYVRVFHTDGRRRTTSANDFYQEGGRDFSFGNWDGESLIVEARPRDGGFILETYTLQANGTQLRIEMILQPDSFRAPINLIRIFDRQN